MKHVIFGPSGLRVSELCLGAMTIGDAYDWGVGREGSRALFDAYLDAGGNFIDTANRYQETQSEALLGEFMEGMRDRLVLATKYSNTMHAPDPNSAGNHRKSLTVAVEESLRRLKTDYIDILWMHSWDQVTRSDEVMRALEYLVASGKILHIGASNTPAWVVSRSNAIAELRGWSSFTGVELPYSLLERSPERETLPMAKALGLGVVAYGCLGSGALTGKYLDNPTVEGGRMNQRDWPLASSAQNEKVRNIALAVRDIAGDLGASSSQVALAWVRAQHESYIPIVGVRTVAQLQDNLAAIDVALSDDHLRRLDQLSAISMDYPMNVLARIASTTTSGRLTKEVTSS
ncbi:MAG TPA: aldo/keto reductase [Caulobacteraceae bacterium]|jgi:aryl-alcohol dehydrogenase-like predicted oxidoreductase|nr:aldo/keto reductase [Caulobacteraceae bacterium]